LDTGNDKIPNVVIKNPYKKETKPNQVVIKNPYKKEASTGLIKDLKIGLAGRKIVGLIIFKSKILTWEKNGRSGTISYILIQDKMGDTIKGTFFDIDQSFYDQKLIENHSFTFLGGCLKQVNLQQFNSCSSNFEIQYKTKCGLEALENQEIFYVNNIFHLPKDISKIDDVACLPGQIIHGKVVEKGELGEYMKQDSDNGENGCYFTIKVTDRLDSTGATILVKFFNEVAIQFYDQIDANGAYFFARFTVKMPTSQQYRKECTSLYEINIESYSIIQDEKDYMDGSLIFDLPQGLKTE
jgi:hypothetical protein